MSDFSDLLRKYLNEKNKNVISMAKYCDTDKSTIYKFLKASRNPASADLVKRMASYLQLSPVEEEKFLEAYQIAVVGKTVYYRRKEVGQFLRNPLLNVDTGMPFKNVKEDATVETIRMFTGDKDVHHNLYEVILSEAQKENGRLSLYLTDVDDRFSEFLISVLHSHQNLSMDYVIVINDDSYEYSRDDSGVLNMKKLKYLLQMAPEGKNRNFYYQYGVVPAGIKYLPYFTNFLLTSETVVLIRNGFEESICINEPAVYKEHRKLFDETLSVSRKLVTFVDTVDQMFYYLSELSFSNVRQKIIFEMCPCLFDSVTKKMLDDYLIEDVPMRETLVQQLYEYVRYNKSVIESGAIPMIHSFEGYRDFMENGLLRDLPSEMYKPLKMDTRIELLERYINSIGNSDLYVLKEAIGPIEHGFYVFIYDHSLMFQFNDRNGVLVMIQMDEFSYMEAFADYLESLIRKTELFYTIPELKAKLTELLNEYKAKYSQTV